MSSDKNKQTNEPSQKNQTTVTQDNDAITSRELTSDEMNRTTGGTAGGSMSQPVWASMSQSVPTG